MTVHLCALYELTARATRPKFFQTDKVIFASIHFAGRGARVVYETDKWSCRSFWSRALTSVDLPAPEGATMMNTLPVMLPALIAIRGPVTFPNGLPDLRRKTRAFFSRLAQGASAKTVCTIRRARSDTGKI